ncbi:MAG: hypothetical protein MPJ02_08980, partial [Nitrosopumilus sp.]|nr:hypothetical protein [Nitrosopumilus sp.]
LALAAGLLAAGAAEVYGASFTTVPTDNIYVNSDEALKRLYVCDGGTITLNPTVASLKDGVHDIVATCDTGDGSPATNTASVTVDTMRPVTDITGTKSYESVSVGQGFTHFPLPCREDAGSPVEPFARLAYVDADNNTIPGITSTTPPGTYAAWFRCHDAAGNTDFQSRVWILVAPQFPTSNLNSPAADSVLEGEPVPGYVSLPTDYKDRHGLTCRPGGAGTPVENDRIVFRPQLEFLKDNSRNTVEIFCLDSNNRATSASAKRVDVIVDNTPPAYSGLRIYFESGPHGSVPTGIISPTPGQTYDQIASAISCQDSFDGTPANAVRLIAETSVTKRTFDYMSLRDKITPQFVDAHRQADGTPIFDVLNATCTDRADNRRSWFWVLAPDRPYHPVEGQEPQLHPVITINDFVTEHRPGPYVQPEGSVECADFLAHELANNDIRTPSVIPPTAMVIINDVGASPALTLTPGRALIPHICSDETGRFSHTYTYAFVPSPDGPRITIDASTTSAPAGQAIPVTATCVDSDNAVRDVTSETFSVHHSQEYEDGFVQDPADSSINREYHVVFRCEDSMGRVAYDSAKFTQTAVGPRIVLDNFGVLNRNLETSRSALDNAHIRGEAFVDPGATCTDTATGQVVTHTVSDAPDEDTALGKWSKVKYTCTAGGKTAELIRLVRTLESRLVTDMPGTTSHDGRPVFVDDAACTSTLGRPLEAVVQRITGPDGSVVESLDHMTPAGTYTIDYLCTDTAVFRGAGGPQHLRSASIPHEFSKQVSVSGPSTAPFISLVGDGQRPVIPGQIYEMAVIPGDKYEELGFACTDRPGLEDVTTVEANFTDGSVIPDDGATIEYTCTAPDGDAAEPQYRRLVPEPGLHVRIDEKEYVVGRASVSDPAPAADTLPTATCYRGTEKVGDDLVITLGSDGRSDNKHRRNLNDDIKISPRWNPDRALSFESWNRTHVMTFRCAGDGTEQPATRSTTFYQIPAEPLMEFPGRTFEDGTETRGSLLRNLHIQGAEFR